jgi:phage terminase large subunit GpA-like protein
MLMVLPTQIIADAFSKAKLAPFINGTPCLAERVGVQGGRASGDTIFRKEFPGGFLNLAGANSPAGLAMQSVRIVLADEIDRFPFSAGREGDPLLLAFKRAQTFSNRKLIVSSTPTVKGLSRIDEFWEMSDQRLYHVVMPCCGVMHVLVWGNVKWRKGEPWTAEYQCGECGELLSDGRLKLAVTNPENRWIATKPENKRVAGFHIWQIYSPWSSLREIVQGYEETKHRADKHEVWWNTTLGESWDQDMTAGTTGETIFNSRIDFPANVIPRGATVVVASVDVQGDRLEVLFQAHGPDNQTWLLDLQKLYGDPSSPGLWRRLDEVLSRRFPHQERPEMVRQVEGVAIDSGGHYTQRVYEFAEKAHLLGRPWFAIKGMPGEGRIAWGLSKVNLKGGAKLHSVGVDGLKAEIYARIGTTDERENRIYVRKAECFDLETCEQIVAERIRQIIDAKGFVRKEFFLPPGTRNELLDLMVYAEAVNRHLNIDHAARQRAMLQTRRLTGADVARAFMAGEAGHPG